MLDLATGTGIVVRRARELCPSLERLVGVDVTAGMLAVARDVADGANAEFVEGDACSLAFEESSFDLVTCQQGLQFFPDRAAAVAGIHRVLAPGGRAVIATWCELESSPAHAAFTAALQTHLPELAGASRNPFALAEPGTLLALLGDAGFVDTTVERVTRSARFVSADAFIRSFAEGSPMAIPLAAVPAHRREAALAEGRALLAPLVGATGLVFNLSTHITCGRKA